jgi:GTP cyclohydrolase I
MYVYELMAGRFEPAPDTTSFPNEGENRFEGMLVARAELRSMCSHHHQPVKGVCYIGIIPTGRVIGLSKYVRIAQWCSRRGQLQEELVNQISREIMKATDTENVGVYMEATHGCMDNRGVMAHSSMTQTSVVHGLFHNDSVKQEFFANIKLQAKSQQYTALHHFLKVYQAFLKAFSYHHLDSSQELEKVCFQFKMQSLV